MQELANSEAALEAVLEGIRGEVEGYHTQLSAVRGELAPWEKKIGEVRGCTGIKRRQKSSASFRATDRTNTKNKCRVISLACH